MNWRCESETLYIGPRLKRLHGFPMKLENFYFIGWQAGRGGKIGKIGKNQAWPMLLVDRLTGKQGGQVDWVMKAWLGKVEGQKIRHGGHEGMVR